MRLEPRPLTAWVLLAVVLGVFGGPAAHAHSQSSSRLSLQMSEERLESISIDLALVDLLQVIDLDRDANGTLTWGELASSGEAIVGFVTDGVTIASGGEPCRLDRLSSGFAMVRHADIPYLRVTLAVQCAAAPGAAAASHLLRYGLFFDINPAHRALVHVTGTSIDRVQVLSPGNAEAGLSGGESLLSTGSSFVREGVGHILSGYDHLVFLLLLILPAAGGGGTLRTRLLRIAMIVTAFTVAHSMTLAAATTGLIHLPARPVEIGIAGSIVLAAVLNVVRPSHRLGWKIAFAFGLLHGFGFAGALQELNLERSTLLVSLLAFNIGVELGQLLVVALVVPILAALSVSARYRSVLVPAASLAGAALGVLWTAARL